MQEPGDTCVCMMWGCMCTCMCAVNTSPPPPSQLRELNKRLPRSHNVPWWGRMVDWLEIRHKTRSRKGGVVGGRPCYIFVGRHADRLLMQTSHIHLWPFKCKQRMTICIKCWNLKLSSVSLWQSQLCIILVLNNNVSALILKPSQSVTGQI